ncbi:hypothetical protein [Amorphus sp. MBR-141]
MNAREATTISCFEEGAVRSALHISPSNARWRVAAEAGKAHPIRTLNPDPVNLDLGSKIGFLAIGIRAIFSEMRRSNDRGYPFYFSPAIARNNSAMWPSIAFTSPNSIAAPLAPENFRQSL